MAKKKKKRNSNVPKLRAWGVPSRKVTTMVIPSKKDKNKTRRARKKQTKKEISEYESLFKDDE